MEKILLDVNIAETYCTLMRDSTHRAGTKNIDSLSLYYKTIFDHYHVSSDDFSKSLAWYKNHPEALDSVYTKMIARIPALNILAGK